VPGEMVCGHYPKMTTTHLRFAAAYQDVVTSTYPLGNGYRCYAPWLMRFNAPDDFSPFGAGGINPYVYCAGDPVNHSDPSGHFSMRGVFKRLFDRGCIKGEDDSIAAYGAAEMVTQPITNAASATGFDELKRKSDWWNSWREPMKKNNIAFVHGSNSASLKGVAKFRALLSMQDMDKTPWLWREGALSSGERDTTLKGVVSGEPISKGLSLIHISDLNRKITKYARPEKEYYPVIYGMGHDIPLDNTLRLIRPFPMWHHLSQESIGIEQIVRIYVPQGRGDEARKTLLDFGGESLSQRVEESSIFENRWGFFDMR
jgi:RHS repeat-associated protein